MIFLSDPMAWYCRGMIAQDIINHDKFLNFVGDDEDRATHMAELFIEQAECYLSELRQSMALETPQEWHDVAHKFKGMAGFAGADCLFNACSAAQNGWQEPLPIKKNLLNDVALETQKTNAFFTQIYGGFGK